MHLCLQFGIRANSLRLLILSTLDIPARDIRSNHEKTFSAGDQLTTARLEDFLMRPLGCRGLPLLDDGGNPAGASPATVKPSAPVYTKPGDFSPGDLGSGWATIFLPANNRSIT